MFAGLAEQPTAETARLLVGFGLTDADLSSGRAAQDVVGFAVYDRKRQVMVASHNLDRSFNLASTTKLFTMAVVGETFRNMPILAEHREELARLLRTSDNRRASLWLLLADASTSGQHVDYATMNARIEGNCYGKPVRGQDQRVAERAAADRFLAVHRARYAIDWSQAQLVDGAGCERAGVGDAGEDRMTPRQYLTVLDELRRQDFGRWNALELMPQMTANGTDMGHGVERRAALRQGVIAWKTGTDYAGIKNIAGFIPSGDDPFAFYYVMLINSGKSPAEGGLVNGKDVVHRFAVWAARTVRQIRPKD